MPDACAACAACLRGRGSSRGWPGRSRSPAISARGCASSSRSPTRSCSPRSAGSAAGDDRRRARAPRRRRAARARRAAGLEAVCRHDAALPRAPARPRRRARRAARRRRHRPAGALAGGELEQGPRAVAIVGTRRASADGLEVARALGRGLAAAGVTVVSGMALGVDSAAHAGALRGRRARRWRCWPAARTCPTRPARRACTADRASAGASSPSCRRASRRSAGAFPPATGSSPRSAHMTVVVEAAGGRAR